MKTILFVFVGAVMLISATSVMAEALAPILTNELYTGGPGNQYGVAITSTDEALYTTITDLAAYQNRITKFSLPLSGSPAWSFQWPGGSYSEQGWLNDILVTEEGIYYAGSSYCLTTDGVGDKETKAILVKFPLDGPTGSGVGGCDWYVSHHMYSYTGGEDFKNMVLSKETGLNYIYIAGSGQANGGGSVATLSKYNMAGTKLWWYPLSTEAYGKTSSAKVCSTIINGKIYAAGRTTGTWSGDSGSIGYIWVRDPNGVALPTISYQEAGKGVCFNTSYYDGQYLYVAGHINPGPSGGQDVLVMKYLPDGTLIWQKTWGGANSDSAQTMFGKNGDLYITGSTSSFGSGADDVFLLQVASADGTFKNQSFAGGSREDIPYGGMTISEDRLFINGYTASTSANGNTPGQYEAMLLSYLLPECTTPPIGDMTGDCKVNLADFAVFAENWLTCTIEPAEACLY